MGDVTVPFGLPYPEATDLVRDGAADIEALAEGVNDQLALGFVYVGTRYYTSSGTFVKADPFGDSSFDGAKLRAIRVRMVGGGGGGGGAGTTGAGQNATGIGGAGAGYAESFITDIAGLATTVTVTRGDGGAGGIGAANGAAGGQSSFGAIVISGGGGFGQFGGAAPPITFNGAGIPSSGASTGQLVVGGQSPAPAVSLLAGFVLFSYGGSSTLSGNAVVSQTGTGANGSAGRNFGGAGSGASNAQNQATARNGGAGAPGIVIVDVFA